MRALAWGEGVQANETNPEHRFKRKQKTPVPRSRMQSVPFKVEGGTFADVLRSPCRSAENISDSEATGAAWQEQLEVILNHYCIHVTSRNTTRKDSCGQFIE